MTQWNLQNISHIALWSRDNRYWKTIYESVLSIIPHFRAFSTQETIVAIYQRKNIALLAVGDIIEKKLNTKDWAELIIFLLQESLNLMLVWNFYNFSIKLCKITVIPTWTRVFKVFPTNVLLVYHLKTTKNLIFLYVFRDRNETLTENGLNYVSRYNFHTLCYSKIPSNIFNRKTKNEAVLAVKFVVI